MSAVRIKEGSDSELLAEPAVTVPWAVPWEVAWAVADSEVAAAMVRRTRRERRHRDSGVGRAILKTRLGVVPALNYTMTVYAPHQAGARGVISVEASSVRAEKVVDSESEYGRGPKAARVT